MISRRRYLPIVCSISIGIIASLLIFKVVNYWEQKGQRTDFISYAMEYANALQNNLHSNIEALRSVGDFFDNSEQITRKEFSGFVNNVLFRHPNIQAISWNPLVQDNERADYEFLAQHEGFENFQFTERSEEKKLVRAGQRQEYVVVYYIAPLETNKSALGFDIASDQIRLQAINQGFNTGKLSVTEKINLVQDSGNQAGVLLLLPMYKKGLHAETPEERHRYRYGFLVEVLRLGDVLKNSLKDFSHEGIDLYLYDMSAEKEDQRFLYSQPSRMSPKADFPKKKEIIQGGFYWSKSFDFGGRQWEVMFQPSTFYFDSHKLWNAWVALAASMFFFFLLTIYLLRKLNYSIEIEERVKRQVQTNRQLEKEIIDRKQAEELLRDSKIQYQGLVESSSDWVWEVNEEGRYTYASPRVKDLLGYEPEEVLHKTPFDLMPPEEAKRTREIFTIAVARQEPISSFENINLHKDGHLVTLETSGVPFFGTRGKFLGYRGIDRDITARKQAENKLRESEKRFKDLTEMLPEAVFETDIDINLTYANQQAFSLFGFTSQDFEKGLTGISFLVPEDREKARENIAKRLRGEKFGATEYTALKKDGSTFPILLQASPIIKQGTAQGLRGVIIDITKRKKAEEGLQKAHDELEKRVEERTLELRETHEQLLHSEKLSAIGRLSASIAHEFNNPLYGIQSVLEGIVSNTSLDEEYQKLTHLALSECGRVKELIKSLQGFSSPSSGVKEATDIHALLDDMLIMVKQEYKNANITIKKQYAADLPNIEIIPDQIKQVFLNLLTNAQEAIKDQNGTVTVTTEYLAGEVAVRISDTGRGISKDELPHIFEPFFSTKSAIKGTGLGLSVSYGIIRAHGGDIVVDCVPGRGTTFSILLPFTREDR